MAQRGANEGIGMRGALAAGKSYGRGTPRIEYRFGAILAKMLHFVIF